MRMRVLVVAAVMTFCTTAAQGQNAGDDPAKVLVSRLTLENYKTTLKGLTQFGDRRQGTRRNRDGQR
jgi:hypothetical protein